MNQEIDNKLLLKVLSGDKKSEKIFIDLCMNCIWGALTRFDQFSHEDKQDVLSKVIHEEIFGKSGGWIGIKKYRGDSKFTTYLYGIVTFRALDYLKSKGIKYRSKTVDVNELKNLFEKTISKTDKITLDMCLATLKDRDQEIVKLASQGYKHREIAEKLETSINNISSALSRAYKKLNEYMQEK